MIVNLKGRQEYQTFLLSVENFSLLYVPNYKKYYQTTKTALTYLNHLQSQNPFFQQSKHKNLFSRDSCDYFLSPIACLSSS